MINYHLNSSTVSEILHCEVENHATCFEPADREAPSNFVIKLLRQSCSIGLHFTENYMILTAAVLSQYTRVTDRETDRLKSYRRADCLYARIRTQRLVSSMGLTLVTSCSDFQIRRRYQCVPTLVDVVSVWIGSDSSTVRPQ